MLVRRTLSVRTLAALIGAGMIASLMLLVGSTPERWELSPVPGGGSGSASSAAPARAYASLPQSFEPNRGQTDPRVDFLSHGRGYSLFLAGGDATLLLSRPGHRGRATALRMRLAGASPGVDARGAGRLPGTVNYLRGHRPAAAEASLPTYRGVTYRGVYPGVDLRYYGSQRQLEYDFSIAPNADPSRIALDFSGGRRVDLAANGDLVLRLASGTLRERAPVAFQRIAGERRPVAARYVVRGDRVSFELGAYDRSRPLTIDPLVLAYSSYLGGGADDHGQAIAVDSGGSGYVTGWTLSADFPTTAGVVDTTENGDADVFVAKLAPDGKSLAYSTYLGGSDQDLPVAIAVDSAGSAYLTGRTLGTDFPTTVGALQTTAPGGPADAFVAKLAPNGQSLAYSTYLGGNGQDEGKGIAVDSTGSAYVTGFAESGDFPTTAGAFDTTLGGTRDAFVAKLASDGGSLAYSTYLGGSDDDGGARAGIAIDSSGSAYVVDHTFSADFPTTAGALDTTLGGIEDAFVAKLAPGGGSLAYSTYLGGGSSEGGPFFGIAVDSADSAYVTGDTSSGDFPTTAGAFDTTFGGSSDAFVSKLAPNGQSLAYSTYLGGGADEFGAGLDLDSAGSAYVTGDTFSSDFPTTADALDTTLAGSQDAFVSKLAPNGKSLAYSTYLGGSDVEQVFGIAVDPANAAYVVGATFSADFPTSAGAFDTTLDGNSDAFVSKITSAVPADLSLTLATSDPEPAAGSNVTLTTTVRNDGPGAASGVTVEAKLPAGLSFVSATPAAGYNPGTGVWTVGNLDAGGTTQQLQVVAKVDDGSPVDATSQVRTSDQSDPDSTPGNSISGEDDESTITLNGLGIVVNHNGPDVNGNDGHCTLREAIIAANTDTASGPAAGECSAGSGADVITLQSSAAYTLAAPSGATPNALPVVSTTVRILGRNSTIARSAAGGTPSFRLIQVTTGDLTLENVKLAGGRSAGTDCGGAIYNQGTLLLKGATLDGNSAVDPGGDAVGGAICNEGALTVANSLLNNNTASGQSAYGGAIHSATPSGKPQASAAIKGTEITGNRATGIIESEGAGVRSLSASLTITAASDIHSNVLNTAAGSGVGGGLAALGGQLAITDSKLRANQITGAGTATRRHGGGIALGQGVAATLTNATIGGAGAGNTALGAGAGISVEGATTTLAVTGGSISNNVSNTVFNTAGGGGGIANGNNGAEPGSVSLTDVTLRSNSCPSCDGGAVFNRGTLTVTRGDITLNSALSGGGVGNGSSVVAGGGTSSFDGVTLAANTADQAGGAVYVPSGSVSLTDSTVKNGKALSGGGLRVDPGASLTLAGSTVSGNSASQGGGIVVLGTAKLTDTTIGGTGPGEGNQADGSGGGIVLIDTGSKLTMTRGAISGNVTQAVQVDKSGGGGLANGGAVAAGAGFPGGSVTLDSVGMSANKAPLGDGGAVLNRGTMTITGGSLTGNSARSGAALADGSGAFPGGTSTIHNTSFADNDAASYGGGLWVSGGSAEVYNSTFERNTASQGGGIANRYGTLVVDNTAVANGTAQFGGGISTGGNSAQPGNTVIRNGSSVNGNEATFAPATPLGVGGGVYAFPVGTLTIHDSTISGNSATAGKASGGGIANSANTDLARASVRENSAASGGGISNAGAGPSVATLSADAVSIAGNHATDGAGGGVESTGLAGIAIDHSAITRNSATGDGGGVHNDAGASGSIDNTTISGNSALHGGAIANAGASSALGVRSSTIADNRGTGFGGGVSNANGALSFANTIIVGNLAGSPGFASDCFGSTTSRGHNLTGAAEGIALGCPHDGAGDERIDSRLGLTEVLFPLADNGGPTLTHGLRPGSPALDAGSPAAPGTDGVAGCSTTDQRGLERARDGDGDGGAGCDIGAVEQQSPLVAPFGLHRISPVTAARGAAGLTLTVRGGGFDAGSVVNVDGAARPTTLVSPLELTARLPASDLATSSDIKTVLIAVEQGGRITRSRPLTIASSAVSRVDTQVVTPGGIGDAYSVPPAPGVLTQIVNGPGGGPIVVSAATYGANPVGGGQIFDSGGFTDLQARGASPDDRLVSTFYYPASITGAAEAALALRYWTGVAWAPVKSSGQSTPLKTTLDNSFGIPSGGYFVVYFDETSTPKLSQLHGTVFAWANKPPAPEAAIAYNATKRDVAVTGIGAATRRSVKPAHSTKPKHGRVRRTYTLRNKAGRKLSLVLEVKKTKKTLVARVLSLRHGGAKAVKPGSNVLSYRWTLEKRKVRTLKQVLSLGRGHKRRNVIAKFDRRTNRTTITDPTRHKRAIKKKGLVALQLVTAAGKLVVDY